MKTLHRRAFTLIELLVVIAIIGLLSSLVVTQMGLTRIKARDSKRISDMTEVKKALEGYRLEKDAYPPADVTATCATGYDCNTWLISTSTPPWDTLQTDLSPYLAKMPVDPRNTGFPSTQGYYGYAYGNVGKTTYTPQYDLTTQLENTGSDLRCAVVGYKWYFNATQYWCTNGGTSSGQIYEASPR